MKYKFGKVTNSRLMGSMGLIIGYIDEEDEFYQYFLLDAEGLGLADYVSLKNPTKDEMHREEDRLMGGLGSDRIRISKDEALFLVKYFAFSILIHLCNSVFWSLILGTLEVFEKNSLDVGVKFPIFKVFFKLW